jgi:hypothetical protein
LLDIHPLNNLRVLKYLNNELAITDQQKNDWYTHWVIEGFKSLELNFSTQMDNSVLELNQRLQTVV